MPQSLRGMPSGFGGQQQQPQQQQQQQGRSVSSRLPNGKIGNTGGSWAFGTGMPMGSGGLQQNQNRQLGGGGNVSFAQSLSGSSPATPLDLSEFPSLSNNPQMANSNSASMWSSTGTRNMSGPIPRTQSTTMPAQQQTQDDPFGQNTSRLQGSQGAFRYGSQTNPQSTAQGQGMSNDDPFPPLNRNAGGEIGSERSQNLMSSLGFGGQNGTQAGSAPADRGNGLLNALSANTRASEVRSPPGIGSAVGRPQDSKSLEDDDEARQNPSSFKEDGLGKGSPSIDDNAVRVLGAIGPGAALAKSKDESDVPAAKDPLEGMPAVDKWGIKGLRTLMHNYPDFQSMVVGIDPVQLGLDLSSPEPISTQLYSLFDDAAPRPTVSNAKFRLPDCYNVTNVQPIDSKIQNFNEETLFWIFYSCPADVKQQLAAVELHSRNWRWHKKLRVWLTKDEHMTPQVLSPSHERGYYIIWDTAEWCKNRREFTLHYGDLDTTLGQAPVSA